MSTKKSYGGYPVSENLWKGYPALKKIAFLLQLMGWLLVISSIIIVITILIETTSHPNNVDFASIAADIWFGITCLIGALTLFAFVELIKVFVRIEINTRKDDSWISTKMDESNQKPKILENDNAKITYNDWKKDHPDGTLNDFYTRKK